MANTLSGRITSTKDLLLDFGRQLVGMNDVGETLKGGLFQTVSD